MVKVIPYRRIFFNDRRGFIPRNPGPIFFGAGGINMDLKICPYVGASDEETIVIPW